MKADPLSVGEGEVVRFKCLPKPGMARFIIGQKHTVARKEPPLFWWYEPTGRSEVAIAPIIASFGPKWCKSGLG